MNEYEINSETLAIIPITNYRSKVVEKNNIFEVEMTPMEIIDNSCHFFGSSYNGRFSGTKNMIGISHKAPIIVEETNEIIFFPTNSPRIYECIWISLNNIHKYERKDNNAKIIFNTGYFLEVNISYGSLDNQVLRAARLESVLRKRKNTF